MADPKPTTSTLCACCRLHPAAAEHPTVDLPKVKRLVHSEDQTVAHVAAVTMAFAGEVEDWKRLAAAEEDPQRAENLRKAGAVAAGMVEQLSIVAQDAEAVSVP